MILSVLIPTLTERKELFEALHNKLLEYSVPFRNSTEILFLEDNKEQTIGYKRNQLVSQASGTFSVFIDDDDDVPSFYFNLIFGAIKETPGLDCIGFKGELHWQNSAKVEIFKHQAGLPYSSGLVNGIYLRPPNHLNPMLTEYFQQVPFPDKSFAEDHDFTIRLQQSGLIKNPVYLDTIMYYYRYNPNK